MKTLPRLLICLALSTPGALHTNAQNIHTVAGNGTQGYTGDYVAATSASLYMPAGIAFDTSDNLLIADYSNQRLRMVDNSGSITTVAGTGFSGFNGDAIDPSTAELSFPQGVATDQSGNIYIADAGNNRVRKITASTGLISTFAGNGTPGFGGDNGQAVSAKLNGPAAIAFDQTGRMYICDAGNNRIRRVNLNGTIVTVAGNGTPGFAGDGTAAINAELNNPSGIAVDAAGNVYIADAGNNRIRKVTGTIISTIAGNGIGGFTGDGANATLLELNNPYGILLDPGGNIYISDQLNNRIRKITPSGSISTIAGDGTQGYSGDDDAASSAQLYHPAGMAFNSIGYIYFADQANQVIRVIAVCDAPATPVIAANGPVSFCAGGSVSLSVTNLCFDCEYHWNNGITGSNHITVSSSGNYTCYATDSCGTTVNSNNITVTVNPAITSYFAVSPNPVCSNQNVTITYNGNATSAASYTWNFSGGTIISGSGEGPYVVHWPNSGTHNSSLFVSENGCTSNLTIIPVSVNSAPNVIIVPGTNQSLCPGESVVLTAQGTTNYLWSTGSVLPSITVTTAGTYTCTGNNAGCLATSTPVVVTMNQCMTPLILSSSNVTQHGAIIHWSDVPCATGYQVYYIGTKLSSWQYINVDPGINSYTLSGLENNFIVKWKIRAKCGNISYTNWSPVEIINTLPKMEGNDSTFQAENYKMTIFPNPADNEARLQLTEFSDRVTVITTGMMGQIMEERDYNPGETAGLISLNLATLPQGLYMITVLDGDQRHSIRLVKN